VPASRVTTRPTSFGHRESENGLVMQPGKAVNIRGFHYLQLIVA